MKAEVVWSKRLWIFIDVAFNVINSQCQAQKFNSDVHPWLQFQYFQFKEIFTLKFFVGALIDSFHQPNKAKNVF